MLLRERDPVLISKYYKSYSELHLLLYSPLLLGKNKVELLFFPLFSTYDLTH